MAAGLTKDRSRLKPADAPNAETRALLIRWGRLHLVRAALGVAATLVMLVALHNPT